MLRQPSQLYTSLTTPFTIMGVEPRLLGLNVGVSIIMIALFRAYWWIALTWVVHQAFKSLSRNDPMIRVIYVRYQTQADRYEPWPEGRSVRGLRPIGGGRGLL